MELASRLSDIALSATLRISAMAAEMRGRGVDVLDFAAGQPDFPTPEPVKEAGREAIRADRTRYTANNGIVELREPIAEALRASRGIEYSADEILVSSGAKLSLYLAFMALLDAGDEVLLPTPYWVSYPEQIKLAQGRPVLVETTAATAFKLNVDSLAAAATPRTRVLVLNYPSNPTGMGYSRAELEPIARFCTERGLWVVADEIYSRMLFDGREFTSVAGLEPDMSTRTILVDGMSKTYSMTGWRIGYAAGPREAIAGMARVQSHVTSNASSISQWASVEALRTPAGELERRRVELERRRDVLVAGLREVPGVSCVVPEGTFYAFPDVSGCFGEAGGRSLSSGADVAEYLLEKAGVAVVPGEAFGAPGHVRLSFATSMDRVRDGVERIREALAIAG